MMKGHSPPEDLTGNFKDELVSALPHLRAFARSLCGNRDMADDLVQDTATKAWAARRSFIPGTSMRAWTFTIMRNAYLSQLRRAKRATREASEAQPVESVPAEQESGLHLSDLNRALGRLAPERRTALLLVTIGDFSYEEAAQICKCPVGTIRSRVARARAELSNWLEDEGNLPQAEGQQRPASQSTASALRPKASGRR